MRILLIGQCSLHWGRMEFGNIGNYYIIEPLFRELHRVFPTANITTTFQMSDDFCENEQISRLPLELYYSWDDSDYLKKTIYEYSIAELYSKTGDLLDKSPYIQEVLRSDLVIDFSGDIWSDNADLVGNNRFLIGLLKDKTAQSLGKKTALLAGSPSPFKNHNYPFVKEVYDNFDLVTNREYISTDIIKNMGFDVSKTKNFACPAFLFEPTPDNDILFLIEKYNLRTDVVKTGFVICGWNLLVGPYNRENVQDAELEVYVELIENHIKKTGTLIYLMSHSNGFDPPPNFKLKHGRDYPFAKQLHKMIKNRCNIDMSLVFLIEDILTPKQTKAVIGHFDMLISGRIHAAVAALSQNIPTVIIDYGHEPKAHKLQGFADIAAVSDFVVDPNNKMELFSKVEQCYNYRDSIKSALMARIPVVKEMAKANFDELKHLFSTL